MASDEDVQGIALLENPHMMSILLYVDEHDGCRKNDIYINVSHNSTVPRKMERLVSAGLLIQGYDEKGKVLSLTSKGKEVASCIRAISGILAAPGSPGARTASGGGSRWGAADLPRHTSSFDVGWIHQPPPGHLLRTEEVADMLPSMPGSFDGAVLLIASSSAPSSVRMRRR